MISFGDAHTVVPSLLRCSTGRPRSVRVVVVMFSVRARVVRDILSFGDLQVVIFASFMVEQFLILL